MSVGITVGDWDDDFRTVSHITCFLSGMSNAQASSRSGHSCMVDISDADAIDSYRLRVCRLHSRRTSSHAFGIRGYNCWNVQRVLDEIDRCGNGWWMALVDQSFPSPIDVAICSVTNATFSSYQLTTIHRQLSTICLGARGTIDVGQSFWVK